MHLRASRTSLASGGRSRPPEPWAAMAVYNGQAAQNRTNFIIWNHSFGPQIRVIMHLRACTTLSLLAVPTPPGCNGSAPPADGPCAPMAYRLGHTRSLKVMKKLSHNFYTCPPPGNLMVNALRSQNQMLVLVPENL